MRSVTNIATGAGSIAGDGAMIVNSSDGGFTSTTTIGGFQHGKRSTRVSVSGSEIVVNGKRYKRTPDQQGSVSIVNGDVWFGNKRFVPPDAEDAVEELPMQTVRRTFEDLWRDVNGAQKLDFIISGASTVKIISAIGDKAGIQLTMRSRNADMQREGAYFSAGEGHLAIESGRVEDATVSMWVTPKTHGRLRIRGSGTVVMLGVDAPFLRVECDMGEDGESGVGDICIRGCKLKSLSCVTEGSDIDVANSNLGAEEVVRAETTSGGVSIAQCTYVGCIVSATSGSVYVDCCANTHALKVTTTSGNVRVMGAPEEMSTFTVVTSSGKLAGCGKKDPQFMTVRGKSSYVCM